MFRFHPAHVSPCRGMVVSVQLTDTGRLSDLPEIAGMAHTPVGEYA
jgi:hypothetical protein